MSIDQRRPDYDQTLKRLLTRAHDGFLAFWGRESALIAGMEDS